MNKKQKNRKTITQNNRNRIINRNYISKIRKITKKIRFMAQTDKENILNESTKITLFELIKYMYSIIDKAVKKKVIHKNSAARKKSSLSKILKKVVLF
jgi:small subunit ribosomal protein S20